MVQRPWMCRHAASSAPTTLLVSAMPRSTAKRNPRDRKLQGRGRRTQPLHSPLNHTAWGTWRSPSASNPTSAHARPPDSRRHPARQTHLAVPVAQPRCASGSGFLHSAYRWSTRRALEPGEDLARLGSPQHGAEPHHLTACGRCCTARVPTTRPRRPHQRSATARCSTGWVVPGEPRDWPRGAFMSRMRTPVGAGRRRGGRGRTARCHRCRDANSRLAL